MRGHFGYSVYGLAMDSNMAIPGLAAGRAGSASLTVSGERGATFQAPSVQPHFVTDLETLWHLDEERWLLRYDGRSMNAPSWQVEACERGRRLKLQWSDPAQVDDIASFLPGPALALALCMRGAFLLHAGAVEIGGRAVLIMGASGAGKSTTLAALLHRGYPVVSDDVAVVTDDPEAPAVHAGPRRLRLYEASAKAAGWDEPLPRLFRHPALDDKKYLSLDDGAAPREKTPIGAIFLLRPREVTASRVRVTRLAAREALAPLLANIYCRRFLDRSRAERSASRCAGIAAGVPVFAVTRPDCLKALPMLIDELLQTLAGIS
jgi:hypothetical protein